MLEYAALVASPRALPDGLILVFQHPVNRKKQTVCMEWGIISKNFLVKDAVESL
ncbi:MAG TPA: hypothetical protein PKV75_12245 [Desulfobacterales bacterium]|nr:hypothetical protein [Desulfobacterales bacterium]